MLEPQKFVKVFSRLAVPWSAFLDLTTMSLMYAPTLLSISTSACTVGKLMFFGLKDIVM